MGNKNNTKKEKALTFNDLFKMEVAEELGLTDKVQQTGWKSLTARESGKIGGIMSRRKKEMVKMIQDYHQ